MTDEFAQACRRVGISTEDARARGGSFDLHLRRHKVCHILTRDFGWTFRRVATVLGRNPSTIRDAVNAYETTALIVRTEVAA